MLLFINLRLLKQHSWSYQKVVQNYLILLYTHLKAQKLQ